MSEGPPQEVWDVAALLRMVRGSEQAVGRVASVFLQEHSRYLETLRAGLSEDDGVAVGQAAHRIKGSAGMLHAREVMELASRLEEAAEREEEPAQLRVLTERLEAALERLARKMAEYTGLTTSASGARDR